MSRRVRRLFHFRRRAMSTMWRSLILAVVVLSPIFASIDCALGQTGNHTGALTAYQACADIRGALSALAKAEREQALALSLNRPGSSTAAIEIKLNDLLAHTQQLRDALKSARTSGAARDPHLEQCIAAGFGALVDAEKLSSDVQAIVLERRGYSGESRALTPPASPPARQPGGRAAPVAPAPAAPR